MHVTREGPDEFAMTQDGPHGASASEATFRWECPICGKAGVLDAEDQHAAKAPLIRHLRYTDGDGHAAHDALPDDLGIHALDDYIHQAS